MNVILENIDKIRNLINHQWKKNLIIENKISWTKLCASLDVIGDAQFSLDFYKEKLDEFDAYKGGYLYIYGVLQSLYVQQDAVCSLMHSLFNSKLDFKRDYPELYNIREARNRAIGHPTSRFDKSFHFMAQHSIRKKGIELWNYYIDKKDTYEFINIYDCIQKQNNNFNSILKNIINMLEKEFEIHKNKFCNQSLLDIFPTELSHYLGKIYEGNDHPLFEMHLKLLYRPFEKIKNEITARYGPSHNNIDLINGLDYIFNKLKKPSNDPFLDNYQENRILAIALENELRELRELLIDIDIEFNAPNKFIQQEIKKRKTEFKKMKNSNVEIILPDLNKK